MENLDGILKQSRNPNGMKIKVVKNEGKYTAWVEDIIQPKIVVEKVEYENIFPAIIQYIEELFPFIEGELTKDNFHVEFTDYARN